MINVALSKGRLGRKVYEMLQARGYEFEGMSEVSRKLWFEDAGKRMRCFWVKAFDVPVYVEYGTADVGICGKDILMERDCDVYEMLDLKAGECRLAVAGKPDWSDKNEDILKVATEYPNITRKYYAEKGREIDIINLRGSIELAAVLGLSDVIVDIVETGTTLRENNLAVMEVICNISARLAVNKSAYHFKQEEITQMIMELSQ